MGRLYLATLVTFGILAGFVLAIALALAVTYGAIPAGLAIVVVLLFNFIQWLIGPWIMDFTQGWLYRIRKIDVAELRRRAPRCAEIFLAACKKEGLEPPMLRLIEDRNPTAYTYGSWPGNARVVFSEGLLHYCDEDEAAAVLCHELGHIRNWDFVLMTIAASILQVLYILYSSLRSIGERAEKAKQLVWIAWAAYIAYIVAQYLVLFLSRTREYCADRFSAETTGNPDAMATSLVKIAYGIAAEPETAATRRLLESTRALGVSDFRSARAIGQTFGVAGGTVKAEAGAGPAKTFRVEQRADIEKVFLFDIASPWAWISELNSTHPLTGRRVSALCDIAKEMGRQPAMNLDHASIRAMNLDRGKLWGGFFYEIIIYFLPHIGLLVGLLPGLIHPPLAAMAIIGLGLGMLLKGLYSFPFHDNYEETTIFDCLCDPYASPLKGRPVKIEGTIIGKAASGSYFGEDVVMQDRSGVLAPLNYESLWGWFGNLFAGRGAMTRVIGQRASARGWFRRSMFHIVDLRDLTASGEGKIESYTRFWGLSGGVLVTLAGIAALVFALVAFAETAGAL